MNRSLSSQENTAFKVIVATVMGTALYIVEKNCMIASPIVNTLFHIFFLLVIFMYMPFVFSSLYLEIFNYAIYILRKEETLRFFTIGLFLLALGCISFVAFLSDFGIILTASAAFFILRAALKN